MGCVQGRSRSWAAGPLAAGPTWETPRARDRETLSRPSAPSTLPAMRSEKDVEAYLLRLNRRYRAAEGQPGTFLVESSGGMPPIAVRVDPPLVVVRVHIGDMKGAEQAALMRMLRE